MRTNRQLIVGILALCFVFFGLTGAVSAAGIDNLTADVGSTYIHWSWDYNNTSQTAIFVDGQFQFNSSDNNYTLSDLNPREYHSLRLTNVSSHSDVYGVNQTKTFYSVSLFYLLFGLSVLFFLLMIFMQQEVTSIVLGTLGFIMSIGCFYLSFPLHLQVFSYISLTIGVLCVLWILMTIFTALKKQADIFEF